MFELFQAWEVGHGRSRLELAQGGVVEGVEGSCHSPLGYVVAGTDVPTHLESATQQVVVKQHHQRPVLHDRAGRLPRAAANDPPDLVLRQCQEIGLGAKLVFVGELRARGEQLRISDRDEGAILTVE